MAKLTRLQGYAFAKKKGDTIHVFEGPHTLGDFIPVIAEGTDVPRMLKDRFADVVNVKDFGAKGDGVTDDTEAFKAALGAGSVAFVPEGQYKIALTSDKVVSSIALNHLVGFGDLVLPDATLKVSESLSVIGGDDDTGPSGGAYSGGAAGTPTVPGRTTASLVALIASQGCRSQGVRAVNVGSIYSWSYGNVSGNYSSRQCVAACPQSANVGCEECEVYGFQGTNIAAHFSDIEAGGGSNVATRLSYSNSENGANVGSTTCEAGKGHGARLSVSVENGSVVSVTVLNAGSGYDSDCQIIFYDRKSTGNGAEATVSVGDSGEILSVTVTSGGSGYSESTDAVVHSGSQYTGNAFSVGSTAKGMYAANVACNSCTTNGSDAVNVGSISSEATGDRAVTIGSTGSHAVGVGAVVISGNICSATQIGSVVIGRRTINDQARSFALGDSSAGSASSANRKFHAFANGNVQAAGQITGSQTFADYAEYFENLEAKEIPLGTIVSLSGSKVRIATAGDDVLGVVSGTAFVIGGDTPFTWAKRFKTGEFGEPLYKSIPDPDWTPTIPDPNWKPQGVETEEQRPQIPNPFPQEEIQIPVENEAYDASIVNVPRSQRVKEWTCVGLLGQLYVRVDESVSEGNWINPGINGVGTLANGKTNLRCMAIKQKFDASKGYAVALCFLR